MSYSQPHRQTQPGSHSPGRSSPLRHTASNASTNSSAYSSFSNPFPPSRTSTVSSSSSSAFGQNGAGHKRGISDMSPTRPSTREDPRRLEIALEGGYKAARQSLRPLPQAPNTSIPPPVLKPHLPGQNTAGPPKYCYDGPAYNSQPTSSQPSRPSSMVLGRTDTLTPKSSTSRRSGFHNHTSPHEPNSTSPDFNTLKQSSTPYLQNLSKFAKNGIDEDFSISSPAPSVAGLSGRRQLKRTDSTRASKATGVSSNGRGSAWADAIWMDKQRQFLQAYEYLCHIGEAKEWIEDIIHQQLPPIVQLEEALRDGVTLAEIVQAFYPDQHIRIFRHPKLQFRHSDNIALFFGFLADMELPELFRFELIDLYEKKNIPKVIYCIHALSWLLYRKGIVDFRIGNLVGQLEFEHHELEEMQKGLDKAGISMPSFSGVGASFGAEPEPEPVESEDERIARELGHHEVVIMDLQSQMRGSLIRIGLGHKMQALWDSEEMLVDLQSIIRGKWAQEITDYRMSMRRFAVDLQSAARGFVIRCRQQDREKRWKNRQGEVITLQSLIRARKVRAEAQNLRSITRQHESSVRSVQAAIRGALQRKAVYNRVEETRDASAEVGGLQAAIRGMVVRQRNQSEREQLRMGKGSVTRLQAAIRAKTARQKHNDDRGQLRIGESSVTRLQAAIRGMLRRLRIQGNQRKLKAAEDLVMRLQAVARAMIRRSELARQLKSLKNANEKWISLQSLLRGQLCRQRTQATQAQLFSNRQRIIVLQATVRGERIRRDVLQVKSSLSDAEASSTAFQAAARAHLLRKRWQADLQSLRGHSSRIVSLQSFVRGCLCREDQTRLLDDLLANEPEIVQLQALSRALLLRSDVGYVLNQLEDEEPVIAEIQASIRGKLVREKFNEKKRFFKANMEKVVKVQSFIRGKLQGEAYKSLTSGSNPPVGTVKGFVHLLNDSDFDFDEEVEFERLRKTVVQHVRQNEMADQYITQLDIKIALLVKNKITLDEVVKHQKHFGGDAGRLLTNTSISSKDPLDLKALNKNSRRKLEHYQELFFILQTQPQYLARLFKRVREQATAEKECERVKHLMMGLFGYAQKRREEYYLIKLITRAIKEEIDSCQSINDYLRGNFFWAKLFGAYIKSPRDRKYMRDILSPIVKESILDNPELDLESDPMQIYLSAIENEQLRTGQRSQRSPDIPREAAIRDPETKRTFITHLQDLRDIADQFFLSLEDHLQKMPFGVRYIAQQMFQNLSSRFQLEEQGYILQLVGHWVWKNYLQPALIEPEKFGVIDRGLSQEHKRNIGEVSKVVGQVAAGRLFGGENVFLQPLNSYVGESIERLGGTWGSCE